MNATETRYYIRDLESDKLHLYTHSKADWLSIPQEKRDEIKRNCLWSSKRNCWISRARTQTALIYMREILLDLAFQDAGEQGSRLSFAEQIEAKQERAADRAERFHNRADRANANSQQLSNTAQKMAEIIPMGQPILVGHHSEKSDRNFRGRIANKFEKAFKEQDKAKHYEYRAEVAERIAGGAEYQNPAFLYRRIEEVKAEIRHHQSRLESSCFGPNHTQPVDDENRAVIEHFIAVADEKLFYLNQRLANCGKDLFTRETLKNKTEILIRGRWLSIVKLNPTTVSVPNICFPTEELQRKYALKYRYAQVREAR